MQVGDRTNLGSALHQKTLAIKGMNAKKQLTQSSFKPKGLATMLKLCASWGPRWQVAIIHSKNFEYCALGFLQGCCTKPTQAALGGSSGLLQLAHCWWERQGFQSSSSQSCFPASSLPACPCSLAGVTLSCACQTGTLVLASLCEVHGNLKVCLCWTFHPLWISVLPDLGWNQYETHQMKLQVTAFCDYDYLNITCWQWLWKRWFLIPKGLTLK